MKQNKETLKGYFETGDIPTQQNFADLIESMMPESSSIVVVEVGDDELVNGQNLLEAYDKAKTLTPNNRELSYNNRASVIVPPGNYNLGFEGAILSIEIGGAGSEIVNGKYYAINNIPEFGATLTYKHESGDTFILFFQGFGWGVSTLVVEEEEEHYMDLYYMESSNLETGTWEVDSGDSPAPSTINVEHSAFTPLLLDTDYVDIIGLTTNRAVQHIYGSPPSSNTGIIVQTANYLRIENLTMSNVPGLTYSPGSLDSTKSAAYFPESNKPQTVIVNCEFVGIDEGEILTLSTRIGVEYSGTYINCKAGKFSFGFNGVASGIFTNCQGESSSFGANGTASGIFTNCQGESSSFGANGTASGIFTNCQSEQYSFGDSGTKSGTFRFCILSGSNFGPPAVGGKIIACIDNLGFHDAVTT